MAQEVVAVEAGFADWPALLHGIGEVAIAETGPGPMVRAAAPVLFVRDVRAAAAWYEAALGFATEFLHGAPPFYGAVARDGVALHLRHVDAPNFAELAAREPALVVVLVEVADARALFAEFSSRDVPFAQPLVAHPWGGIEFHVRDPDGNVVGFVSYRAVPTRTG